MREGRPTNVLTKIYIGFGGEVRRASFWWSSRGSGSLGLRPFRCPVGGSLFGGGHHQGSEGVVAPDFLALCAGVRGFLSRRFRWPECGLTAAGVLG